MSMRLLLKDRHIYLCGHLAVILGGSEPLWRLLSGNRVFFPSSRWGSCICFVGKIQCFHHLATVCSRDGFGNMVLNHANCAVTCPSTGSGTAGSKLDMEQL